jgi:hypothetical protein
MARHRFRSLKQYQAEQKYGDQERRTSKGGERTVASTELTFIIKSTSK